MTKGGGEHGMGMAGVEKSSKLGHFVKSAQFFLMGTFPASVVRGHTTASQYKVCPTTKLLKVFMCLFTDTSNCGPQLTLIG